MIVWKDTVGAASDGDPGEVLWNENGVKAMEVDGC